MDKATRVAEIRGALPAVHQQVYLNTGTCGPLPIPAFEAMQAATRRDLERGRISGEAFDDHNRLRARARAAFARLLQAQEDEIALTHHTGEGLNIVLAGLPWREGDEVLSSDVEHASLLLPLAMLEARSGVRVRRLQGPAADWPAIAEAAITPQTRLIALSHVSYATGAVFPLAEIVAVAHARGVSVLVDGAQSAGALPLDLPGVEVDFYALPGQKWLCGPEGTGALFVRRDRCADVNPAHVGYYSVVPGGGDDRPVLHAGGQRFEVGGQNIADLAGISASLEWLAQSVGWEWAVDRIRRLSALAGERLAAQPGVRVLTPSPFAGLVSFTVEGRPPAEVVRQLAEESIIIRSIPQPLCCRISVGFFNLEEELERVVERIGAIARAAA